MLESTHIQKNLIVLFCHITAAKTKMPVATRRSKLYEAILKFEEYYKNDPTPGIWAFDSHALGGWTFENPRTLQLHIENNWNLLRQLWEEESKPHTFITLKMYLRWKQNRSKD